MASCATIPPDKILALASAIRNDGSSAAFCFGTDEEPFAGGECRIYAVKFPDDTTWAVRIPVHAGKGLPANSITTFVEAELAILAKLGNAGFRWSPKLIGYDSRFDNPIRHPYFMLSWIPGTPLEWTEALPSDRQHRHKVLRQFVDIQLELAECTKELRAGSSAMAYLTDTIDRKITRVATGKESGLNLRDCFTQRALIHYAIHDSLESSILAISHDDLAAQNIMVDSEYNITGIIDWGFARILPLQLAFRLPRFLAIEPSVIDSPPPTDIPTFSTKFLQPSSTLLADRQFLISYLSSLIPHKHSQGIVDRVSLARSMKVVISDLDVDWRYLLIESCSSKGFHTWMARRSWLLHGTKGDMAALIRSPWEKILDKEVESFLTKATGENGLSREALLEAIKNSKDGHCI